MLLIILHFDFQSQTYILFFAFNLTLFSVGCVIPHDRTRFPFNDMEISMIDICILDILIISILELFHAFFHAHKRGKAHFSALISMEKLHAYHLGL